MPPDCPDCKGGRYFRQDVPVDDPHFGKLIRCNHPIHDPERLNQIQKVSQLGEGDIKICLSDINVTDDNRDMITAAKSLLVNPWGWLYIWGPPGNAKTETLIAIINELNRSGKGPAIYSTLGQILDWIRQAYGPACKDDYLARFERLKQMRVLAIDEMDKPRETEWVADFRFHFLDDRYRSAINGETVTLFAGNKNPNTFDEVIFDRIRDNRFNIIFNGASSARPNMQRIVENVAGDARPDEK